MSDRDRVEGSEAKAGPRPSSPRGVQHGGNAESEAVDELCLEEARNLIRQLQAREAALTAENERLEADRVRLAARYDQAPVGFCTVSIDDTIREANETIAKMLGVPRAALVGGSLHRLVAKADVDLYFSHRRCVLRHGENHTCQLQLIREDAAPLSVLLCGGPVISETGEVAAQYCAVAEITPEMFGNQTGRQAEAIIETAADGVVVLDDQWRIVRANPAFSMLTGWRTADLVGHALSGLIVAGTDDQPLACAEQVLAREGRWRGELWWRREDGTVLPAQVSLGAIRSDNDAVRGIAGVIRDVSEHKRLEGQLRQQAYYDPLTGLANRFLFIERLKAAISQAQRQHQLAALFQVDIDGLKDVMERYGSAAGETVLQVVAERLGRCVRARDTVARVGGDELAIIVTEIKQLPSVATVADKILSAFSPSIRFAGHEIRCTSSIGVAVYPNDTQDAETLQRFAELATDRAKADGRNRYRFFKSGMGRQGHDHARMMLELERALRWREFQVLYQPIVDAHTGAFAGAEALLRWNDPHRGLLRPEAFLADAEDTGQIVPLGRWVMETVRRDVSAWRAALGSRADSLFVFVNVSPQQLRHADAFDPAGGHALPQGAISLEISERCVAAYGVEAACTHLHAVRERGLGLVMDHFGTGYSALGYLKQLPLDTLKIHRFYIHEVERSLDAAHLVEAVIHMAHVLRINVVAEGIEMSGQLDFARRYGCDYVQGEYIAAPVSGEHIGRLIDSGDER